MSDSEVSMVCIASTPVAGQELPVNVAAVWGGFLYEGLLAPARDQERVSLILDRWGCGCLELVMAVCDYLPGLWQQIADLWNRQEVDFPGVFEYEVVSAFGAWLGDWLLAHEGRLPDRDTATEAIARLIARFLHPEWREVWRGPLVREVAPNPAHCA